MLGGAVVERRALTHPPPHVFLLSQPVRRVGSFPRGGEWTTCAVVCRPLAHTHQPSSRVEGGAVVEHVALTHQPPSEPLLLPLLSRRGPARRSRLRLRTRRRGRLPMRPVQRRLFRCRSQGAFHRTRPGMTRWLRPRRRTSSPFSRSRSGTCWWGESGARTSWRLAEGDRDRLLRRAVVAHS